MCASTIRIWALDGGNDGYDAYRALIPQAAERLAPGGALIVEAGQGQARDIETLMTGPRVVCGQAAQGRFGGHPAGGFGPEKCPHKSRIGLQKTSWNIPWERLRSGQHMVPAPSDPTGKSRALGRELY